MSAILSRARTWIACSARSLPSGFTVSDDLLCFVLGRVGVLAMIALNPVPGIPWVAVSFPFDPQLIALVKQVPGRKWDQKTRSWYFPANLENIATFLATLPPGVPVSVHPALHHAIAERTADIAAAQAAKRNGDSNMAFDYLTAPYAHQRAGLALLSRLGSGALLWEMGLGKTKTAIDYAEWLHAERVLVVTPKTVARNWAAEIEKHAGHRDYVVLADGSLAERAKHVAVCSSPL